MKYLYCRVSTDDKNQDFKRQHYIMEQKGLVFDKVFEEKITGKTRFNEREEFEKMIEELKPYDELYVESMSRIGRNLTVIFDTINFLVKEKKVKVIIIKENLVLEPDGKLNAMTTFMLNLFACISQLERDLISERISDKLQALKKEGVKLGRPSKFSTEEIEQIKEMYDNGCKYSEITSLLGISKPTIIKLAKENNWLSRR